jgi:hypothetical protein
MARSQYHCTRGGSFLVPVHCCYGAHRSIVWSLCPVDTAVIVVSCCHNSYWCLLQNIYITATAVTGDSYRCCHGIHLCLLQIICYQSCRQWRLQILYITTRNSSVSLQIMCNAPTRSTVCTADFCCHSRHRYFLQKFLTYCHSTQQYIPQTLYIAPKAPLDLHCRHITFLPQLSSLSPAVSELLLRFSLHALYFAVTEETFVLHLLFGCIVTPLPLSPLVVCKV